MADLTAEEFAAAWTDRPFILTDVVPRWPAFGGASGRGERWTLDWLVRRHGDVSFRAEAVDWPFRLYHSYLSATLDESPLYLFDQGFAEKMGLELGQQPAPGDVDGPPPSSSSHPPYTNPTCFGADLFALLGASRPAHRWLIAGPARSGSTFHHDPNATSAWNAVLQGSKYWVMFPPHITPPGVFVSPDGAEVTSPLSIAEWLLGFHAEARETPGCIEAICGAGEILHVPSGWWHLVVNLEPGVAVTQNFVPQARLAEVLKFLRDRPEQVTGFDGKSVQDPYGLFVERLREACPDVLEEALRKLKLRDGKAGGKRKWDTVVAGDAEREAGEETARAAGAGFSFGFGVAGDDDVEEDDFS